MDYEVTIKGELPKGAKIAKIDGTEATKFSEKDKFKIMLPKDKLTKDGEFTLNIKTEVKTKPVLYGASPSSDWQNYALTAYLFEDATSEYKDTYKKIEKPEEPEKPKTPTPETPKQEIKKEEAKILPVTGM